MTALLKYGADNLLEVKVSKHSANKSVNEAERKADFWLFGGIFRPVYLEALPSQHIESVAIDAKADGQFKAEVKVVGSADRVAVQLYTAEGEKYGLPFEAGLKKGSAMISGSFNSLNYGLPSFLIYIKQPLRYIKKIKPFIPYLRKLVSEPLW